MRAAWLWVTFTFGSACASSPPAKFINTCTEYATPRVDPNAVRPSQDRILAQAHAIFDALDRADEAGFQAELGQTFALIDAGVVHDRAFLLDEIRARAARGAPERTRTWQNEQIWISDSAAVFVGESLVHAPGDDVHPGGDFAGWHTLVFAPERSSYRAVSWQWASAVSRDR